MALDHLTVFRSVLSVLAQQGVDLNSAQTRVALKSESGEDILKISQNVRVEASVCDVLLEWQLMRDEPDESSLIISVSLDFILPEESVNFDLTWGADDGSWQVAVDSKTPVGERALAPFLELARTLLGEEDAKQAIDSAAEVSEDVAMRIISIMAKYYLNLAPS